MKKLFQYSMLFLLAVSCAAFAGGCSKARINAKDAETYRKTLQSMRQTLPAKKQEALDRAIEKIFQYERKRAAEYGSGMGDTGIMLLLDNLTADEIILRAQNIKK